MSSRCTVCARPISDAEVKEAKTKQGYWLCPCGGAYDGHYSGAEYPPGKQKTEWCENAANRNHSRIVGKPCLICNRSDYDQLLIDLIMTNY